MLLENQLSSQLAFYAKYHTDKVNIFIHVICVPLIYFTAIVFSTAFSPTLAWATTAVYVLGYIALEPRAGLLYAPLLIAEPAIADRMLHHSEHASTNLKACIVVHVLCWLLQFYGHGKHEKRAPALLDSLFQAFFLAPLFVWLEVLFQLGYRKPLKQEMDEEVRRDKTSRGVKVT